jgi:hypothetical protein
MRLLAVLVAGLTALTLTSAVAQTADQYMTPQIAQTRCGSDPVVWVNLDTKVWHVAGDKYYGNTKHGAYMCRTVAGKSGMRAEKS